MDSSTTPVNTPSSTAATSTSSHALAPIAPGGTASTPSVLALACDATGTTCSIRHLPALCQTDPRIDADVRDQGPDGSYDASIVSVAIAALANRSGRPATSGRTAEFESLEPGVKAGSSATIPREITQLSWAYRTARAPDHLAQPYSFDEIVHDFGPSTQSRSPHLYGNCGVATNASGAAFRDFIGSETHVTNAYVQSLMRDGFVPMIGFARLGPAATYDPSLGGYRVTFRRVGGQHKVVFSGFQPGPYPLRILDVGSGQTHRVKLVHGFADRAFGDSGASGAAIKRIDFLPDRDPRSGEVTWSFGGSRRIYLEYEGQRSPTDGVLFVEHLDALSLRWRPPRAVWHGTWDAGWTHFVPFPLNSQPHVLAYNATTGDVHFDRLHASGADTRWSGTWAAGWTHLVPFSLDSQPHVLAYNATSGDVHFDHVHADGPDSRWMGRWSRGWTHLVPFALNNQPHMLAYDATTGDVHFERVHANGPDTRWSGTWPAGWTHVMPFVLDDQPHFIAYNATSGDVHFDRVRSARQAPDIRLTAAWATGWTHLTPVPSLGMPHFTTYNSVTGAYHFDRVAAGANGHVPLSDEPTVRGRGLWLSFMLNGQSHQVAYDARTGSVTVYQLGTL